MDPRTGMIIQQCIIDPPNRDSFNTDKIYSGRIIYGKRTKLVALFHRYGKGDENANRWKNLSISGNKFILRYICSKNANEAEEYLCSEYASMTLEVWLQLNSAVEYDRATETYQISRPVVVLFRDVLKCVLYIKYKLQALHGNIQFSNVFLVNDSRKRAKVGVFNVERKGANDIQDFSNMIEEFQSQYPYIKCKDLEWLQHTLLTDIGHWHTKSIQSSYNHPALLTPYQRMEYRVKAWEKIKGIRDASSAEYDALSEELISLFDYEDAGWAENLCTSEGEFRDCIFHNGIIEGEGIPGLTCKVTYNLNGIDHVSHIIYNCKDPLHFLRFGRNLRVHYKALPAADADACLTSLYDNYLGAIYYLMSRRGIFVEYDSEEGEH